MYNYGKTVAAISTPRGKGGVAMVRISGSEAVSVAERVFCPASGKKIGDYAPNTMVHGSFHSHGTRFDDGMCVIYRAPHSFTGEDAAELFCHGGMLVTSKLLEAVIEAGAEYAGPGEFTRRAFLGGKLTLTEAEAVGDMIDAVSDAHLSAGLMVLDGRLSSELSGIYDKLRTLAASAYAYIDYPDEDLTDVTVEEMRTVLDDCRDKLVRLYKTSRYGRAISEGVETAIVGRPNTGKSSLLNLLCGRQRAIVTDIEGTTRDVVSERAMVGDVLLILSDTAGIRDSDDVVERLGIEKSFGEIDSSSLVLLVLDGAVTDDDKRIIDYIKAAGKSDVTIAVFNKSDLGNDAPLPGIFSRELYFSALTGEGLDELRRLVGELCGEQDCEAGGLVITSARQSAMLKRAADAVEGALTSLDGFTQDIAGLQIEEAMGIIAELDGRQASAEIVDEIFSRFCVGK